MHKENLLPNGSDSKCIFYNDPHGYLGFLGVFYFDLLGGFYILLITRGDECRNF